MFELKPLHPDSIPTALEKATRYRLLGESGEAESICLDVLRVVPDHPQALVTLLLAITDRFEKGYSIGATRAHEVLAKLRDEYERAYYAGLISERQAKALLRHNSPGAAFDAYELLREAMDHYEKAESLRSAGNDDALLRWNACARIIMANRLEARSQGLLEPPLE